MRIAPSAALLGAILSLVLAQTVSAAPPTVTGKIHGQRFKAVAKGGVTRNLIQSRFRVEPSSGMAIFALTAAERPKRGAPYQIIVMACAFPTATPPLTADCTASYSEVKLRGRRFSQKLWLASLGIDATGTALVGPFHVTIDSFDGTTVRGSFSGSLESYQVCTPGCVDATDLGTASGEGTFAVPAEF